MKVYTRVAFFLAATALTCSSLIGCGGRSTYQVSGRVQYADGSPLTGGTRIIRLEPTDDTTAEIRKVASGYIEPDGTFEMFTRKPGDGVIAGKYWVTFSVMDKPMGGKSLIAEKFTRIESTPFEILVDEDKSGLLYELEKL
jgi:hypothetical protein